MSWLCLNCETVNFDAENKCIVCGEERYYSTSEVKQLLENHPETKALREQAKKLSTQNKWLQTRNKNLTQENKQLQADLEYQSLNTQKKQNNTENIFEVSTSKEKADEAQNFKENIYFLEKKWTRKLRIWQVSTLIATCIAIFLWVKR